MSIFGEEAGSGFAELLDSLGVKADDFQLSEETMKVLEMQRMLRADSPTRYDEYDDNSDFSPPASRRPQSPLTRPEGTIPKRESQTEASKSPSHHPELKEEFCEKLRVFHDDAFKLCGPNVFEEAQQMTPHDAFLRGMEIGTRIANQQNLRTLSEAMEKATGVLTRESGVLRTGISCLEETGQLLRESEDSVTSATSVINTDLASMKEAITEIKEGIHQMVSQSTSGIVEEEEGGSECKGDDKDSLLQADEVEIRIKCLLEGERETTA